MKDELREFIETYIDLIEDNNFAELYNRVDVNTNVRTQDLTVALLQAGINPLDHLTFVPPEYMFKCPISVAPTVVIPKEIKTILPKAFEETDIQFITVPEGVTTISSRAFAWCQNMETIELPSTIRHLHRGIFIGCFSLKTIKYNGTIEEWQEIDKDAVWFSHNFDAKSQVTLICTDGETCVE